MIKTILKILLFVIIFAALGAGGAYLFFEKIHFDKKGEVPSLEGKSLSEATVLLAQRKLSLDVTDRSFDANIPEGYIVKQLVNAGEKIKPGSAVGVIVSKGRGQEMFSMPSFEGQRLEDAKLTLTNLNIGLGKVTLVHSDTADKDVIISQRPLPGNTTDNEINFLVSLGPYDVFYKCPQFVKMTIDDARKLTDKLGIRLIEQEEGIRISAQKPAAGEIIKKGDAVEVTLGRSRAWF